MLCEWMRASHHPACAGMDRGLRVSGESMTTPSPRPRGWIARIIYYFVRFVPHLRGRAEIDRSISLSSRWRLLSPCARGDRSLGTKLITLSLNTTSRAVGWIGRADRGDHRTCPTPCMRGWIVRRASRGYRLDHHPACAGIGRTRWNTVWAHSHHPRVRGDRLVRR